MNFKTVFTVCLWKHTEHTPGAEYHRSPADVAVEMNTHLPLQQMDASVRWSQQGSAGKRWLLTSAAGPKRDPQHLQGQGETRTQADWHGPLPHQWLWDRSMLGLPGPVGSLTRWRGPLPPQLPAAREARLIHPVGFFVEFVVFFFLN